MTGVVGVWTQAVMTAPLLPNVVVLPVTLELSIRVVDGWVTTMLSVTMARLGPQMSAKKTRLRRVAMAVAGDMAVKGGTL